jgi:hypothetical protein
VSPVKLNDGEGRGGRGHGAKSYEPEKAWPSINHSIFSDLMFSRNGALHCFSKFFHMLSGIFHGLENIWYFPNPGDVAQLEFLALNHREINNPQGQRETKLSKKSTRKFLKIWISTKTRR